MPTIHPADPTTAQARGLLQASHDMMTSLFPAEANHFLSVEELAEPHIGFYEARDRDTPVGCAAIAKMLDYGEVKSMFVAEASRGRGVGNLLMVHIIKEARALGLTALKLETGVGLDAAHRLYERHGFAECAAFGGYEADAPHSRYMERAV